MLRRYTMEELNAMSDAEYIICSNEVEKEDNDKEFVMECLLLDEFVGWLPKPLQVLVRPLTDKFIALRELDLIERNKQLDIEIDVAKRLNK